MHRNRIRYQSKLVELMQWEESALTAEQRTTIRWLYTQGYSLQAAVGYLRAVRDERLPDGPQPRQKDPGPIV
jgi:hypothetical protein